MTAVAVTLYATRPAEDRMRVWITAPRQTTEPH
jgi:hypothetical protein